MYDESWFPQLAHLPCKNGNDCYETDSNLARFFTDESGLEEFLVDDTLSQVCSTDEKESKGIIVDESSTEESESECIHKNINK